MIKFLKFPGGIFLNDSANFCERSDTLYYIAVFKIMNIFWKHHLL